MLLSAPLKPSAAIGNALPQATAIPETGPDKDQVEWVMTDMYHVYRDVAHQALPKARIVVDRFHIEYASESEVVRAGL